MSMVQRDTLQHLSFILNTPIVRSRKHGILAFFFAAFEAPSLLSTLLLVLPLLSIISTKFCHYQLQHFLVLQSSRTAEPVVLQQWPNSVFYYECTVHIKSAAY